MVDIEEMGVQRGAAEIRWYNTDRDSVVVVRDLMLSASRFHSSADSLVATIDGLSLEALAPEASGGGPGAAVQLAAAGAFSRERLTLRDLTVTSEAGTDVSGFAVLRFPQEGDDNAIPMFEADLQAQPFALADARAFTGLSIYGRPRVRLSANSDGERLDFTLRGSLDPESGDARPATVVLDGQLDIQPNGGPLATRVNGELRNLDPGAILGNPALAADLNGTISADLKGRSPEALTGPFEIALNDSRVGAQIVERLRLDGSFRTGTVDFRADAAVPGLIARARGAARPFDRVPSVETTGTLDEFDLARLTGDPSKQARLRGDFALEGRGTTLATLIGSAAVTLNEASFPVGADGRVLRLAASEFDATFRGGLAAFDVDVALASGGRLEAIGTADLTDEPIPYRVSRGQFTRLDLATLTGNPDQASDITGSFTLQGSGFDPQTSDIAATLRLAPSRLPVGENGLQVASATVDARLRGGGLTFDAAADLGETGSFTARGTARPFADPLTYDASGSFSRLNVAAITGDEAQASDLSGTFTARGSGIDPQTLTTSGTLNLASGYYGDRDIDGANLTFRLASGALSAGGTVALPEGQFALDVTGRPFDDNPSFALGENTCFSDLDVGRLTDNPDLSTDLNGCFQGSISGFDPEVADGSGVVTLQPSRINAAEVSSGQVSFSLNDGAVGATVDLRFVPTASAIVGAVAPEASSLFAVFQGRPFADEPTYALTGRTEFLDVNALLPSAPTQPLQLTADFDLQGTGFDPLEAVASGEIVAEPSAIAFAQIQALTLDFALDRGTLRLDTLLLRSDIANLSGGGQIAIFDTTAATDFRLVGEAADLSALSEYAGRPLAADRVALDLTIVGAAGEPLDVNGTVEARTFAAGDILLTGLDATLDATLDPQEVLNGTGIDVSLDARFDLLQTPAIRVQSGDFTANYDGEDIRVAGAVIVDQDRDLAFDARVEIDPEPDVAPGALGLQLERADFRLGETRWALAQESSILFGEVIQVRGLLLQSVETGQQIAADGTLDMNGEQNFVLTAEEVDIGVLTDLIGFGSLDGTLSAALLLTGPAEAPLLDGSLTLEDLTSNGELFGAMDAQVNYASGRLDLDAVLTHRDGEELLITGYVPTNLSLTGGAPELKEASGDEGVQIRLQADAFPVAWAQPFLAARGYTDIGGTLRADVTISGTQEAPDLTGDALLTGGRLGVAATGMTYEPLYARLGFEGNRILLEDVRIDATADTSATDTKLAVTGDITLQELSVGELDLTIQPSGFVAIDTRTYDRLVLDRGSRPLRLTGTLQEPRLRGSIVLASGDIYLTDELVPPELEPVELTDEQIRLVEARFGRRITKRDTAVSRFTDALDYELDVEIRRNVWIRSESGIPFDIEFAGDVTATKRPFADGSQLSGSIDLVRGNVETLGKRFELQRGRLIFNGSPLAANVNLLATLDAKLKQGSTRSPIEINLNVNGNLDQNPEVRLSSPQLSDPADIVSVIATGQLSGDLFGANAVTGLGTGLALGQISGLVEGVASEKLGLDLVEIDSDGSDLVIRIGKYLTNNLFTSVGYVVVPSPTDRSATDDTRFVAGLDYELLAWLLLQGEYSGERGLGGGLRTERAW